MSEYGVLDSKFVDMNLNLHGMTVERVTWHNGTHFYRFRRDGRHHDAPMGVIDGPQGQCAVDAIRNTFDYYMENA